MVEVTTWADAFGVWYARLVSTGRPSEDALFARRQIVEHVGMRCGVFDRESVQVELVSSEHGSVVYKERV